MQSENSYTGALKNKVFLYVIYSIDLIYPPRASSVKYRNIRVRI